MAAKVQNYVRQVHASNLDRTPAVLTEILGGFPPFLHEYSSTLLLSDCDGLLLDPFQFQHRKPTLLLSDCDGLLLDPFQFQHRKPKI